MLGNDHILDFHVWIIDLRRSGGIGIELLGNSNHVFGHKSVRILDFQSNGQGAVHRSPVLRKLLQRLIQLFYELPLGPGQSRTPAQLIIDLIGIAADVFFQRCPFRLR